MNGRSLDDPLARMARWDALRRRTETARRDQPRAQPPVEESAQKSGQEATQELAQPPAREPGPRHEPAPSELPRRAQPSLRPAGHVSFARSRTPIEDLVEALQAVARQHGSLSVSAVAEDGGGATWRLQTRRVGDDVQVVLTRAEAPPPAAAESVQPPTAGRTAPAPENAAGRTAPAPENAAGRTAPAPENAAGRTAPAAETAARLADLLRNNPALLDGG